MQHDAACAAQADRQAGKSRHVNGRGILPIVNCVDLSTIERRANYTAGERGQLRTEIETRHDDRVAGIVAGHPGDTFTLSAVVVWDWMPGEDNIWRLEFEETEPERAKPEPVELPSPSWPELREAYAAANARRRAQRSPDASDIQ